GNAHYSLDRLDKAVVDYTSVIALDAKDVVALVGRGWAYNKMGQPKKAIEDFSRGLALEPNFAYALWGRGWSYNNLRQPDRAVPDLTKAIELSPDDPNLVLAYLERAQANARLNRFEQARTDFQTFLKRAPSHAGGHNDLAWLLASCPDVKLR